MYCDFCGKQLSTNVKYCRHCGRLLIGRLEDTRPLPVIDDAFLSRTKQQVASLPWSALVPLRKTPLDKGRLWRKAYELASVTTIIAMLYVLMTFATIQQYQILTSILGVILAAHAWRRSRYK